ncbi:MAG: hypothetical protein HFE52_07310 [Clostridia bacterium]|nr:hypothetical protein [Clostridia bacterium]
MINEKEKTKNIKAVFEILKDIRKDISQTDRLIRLLENGKKIKQCCNDQYEQFCKMYLVMLLEDKISDQLKREIMYVAYGLLQGFENDKTIKDRHRLYAQKAYGINAYIKQWKNPDDSLSKYENQHIINKLAEDLIEDALTNEQSKGILGFADEVIKNLSERFPEGIHLVLPLPEPKFVKKDSKQKGCQRAQEKINDDIDENPKELSADNLRASIDTDDSKEDTTGVDSSIGFGEDEENEPEKGDQYQENQYIWKELNKHSEITYICEGDKINSNHIENNADYSEEININGHVGPTINVINIDGASSNGKNNDRPPDKPPRPPRERISLRAIFALIFGAVILLGIGMVIGGCTTKNKYAKEVSTRVDSSNSGTRKDIIATSIEVDDEKKNIELAPGGYDYLIVRATPSEINPYVDLDYTSSDPEIVTTRKNYIEVLHGWKEGMPNMIIITIQGGGTAEAKAYVFIKSTDSKGISAGNNMDSD